MAFRKQYYYNLEKHVGFKVEPNVTSSLDTIFSSDKIDLINLQKICLRCSIPPTYRAKVWKLLLQVFPCYKQAWKFIQQQNQEQYEDLQRTSYLLLDSLSPVCENDSIGNHSDDVGKIIRIHTVHNYINLVAGVQQSQVKKNTIDIAKVFANVFTDPVDAYFCFHKLVTRRKGNEETRLERMIESVENLLKAQELDLYHHLHRIQVQLETVCYSWFSNFFASCLPTHVLKKIWDKIISAGDIILSCYGFALLKHLAPVLLLCRLSQEVLDITMAIPGVIISKFEQVHDSALLAYSQTEESVGYISPKGKRRSSNTK